MSFEKIILINIDKILMMILIKKYLYELKGTKCSFKIKMGTSVPSEPNIKHESITDTKNNDTFLIIYIYHRFSLMSTDSNKSENMNTCVLLFHIYF